MKYKIEILRRRICRKAFKSAVSSINEATYIHLNSIHFETECDSKFLKFNLKMKESRDKNKSNLDTMLFNISERKNYYYN